MSDMRSKKFML